MNAKKRFLLATALLGLLMTGPFLVTAGILMLDLKEAERAHIVDILLPRLPIGILMTLVGFVLGMAVLRRLFRQYVRGLRRMGEHLHLMLGANRNFRVAPEGPPEVQELARAANDLAPAEPPTPGLSTTKKVTTASAEVQPLPGGAALALVIPF